MTATNMCSNFGGKWDSPPLTNCYTEKRNLEKRDRFSYDLPGMLAKPIRLQ